MGIYAIFTVATALLVAIVLIPVLRLVFMPEPVAVDPQRRPGKRRRQRSMAARSPAVVPEPADPEADARRAGSMAGGLGVLVAVAALVPMGGDGFLLRIVEPRLALAMLLALGLILLGMTRSYQNLGGRQRLWLQLAFATAASVVGLMPAGVRPDALAHILGALFLLACMNTFRGLDSTDGLASIVGAVAAAVMAFVAHSSGSPAWGDLNLGLCGALTALLAYNMTHGRFRAELGTGGTLAVGFLLGATILRLGEQAIPTDRAWLALPISLPLINLAFILLVRHIRNLPLDIDCQSCRDNLHHQLFRAGLTANQVLILYGTTAFVTGMVSLQFLDMI